MNLRSPADLHLLTTLLSWAMLIASILSAVAEAIRVHNARPVEQPKAVQ